MLTKLPNPIKIIVKQVGKVRIHTFVSSFGYDNIANATHIIESEQKLVLIDAQFLAAHAVEFRHYANSLKKPIDRIYISHRHPDHWFGLYPSFKDVAIYALPETINFIKTEGANQIKAHAFMGDLAPKDFFVPNHEIKMCEDTIDGVKYIFDKVTDTEIDFLLTIKLPDLKIYIVQDLIYSGTHLFLYRSAPIDPTSSPQKIVEIEKWIEVLEGMLLSDYELFLPGHGLPADKNEVARNIEYLATANQAIENGLTNQVFRDFMIRNFPERKCQGIFDIYLPRLFGSAKQY